MLAAVSALAALAAWPAFVHHEAASADPVMAQTPAPLRDDALVRRDTIAFEERRLGRDPADPITPRMLGEQYLQRYRERGDVGDVVRAEAMARRSLVAQPRGNVAALGVLAGSLLTLHRFREARAAVREARFYAPDNPGLAMEEASLDMELGAMSPARDILLRYGNGATPESEIAASRYDELTGRLADARVLLDRASHRVDAIYDVPAERRAWFHTRLGELAFNAGDTNAAIEEERTALARFPGDAKAWTDLGKFDAANGDWNDARDDAQHAVSLIPSPENLGLLADAQAALGDGDAAAATRDEIDAVARIGNAYHLADRLLAVYYADHDTHHADAYAIAKRELAARDDVYAQDTLAWTAARAGLWNVAADAARNATATNIEDPHVWYHAAFIADHRGDRAAAIAAYRHALNLNPHFDPTKAPIAKSRLATLSP